MIELDLKKLNAGRPIQLQRNKRYWLSFAFKQDLNGEYIAAESVWTRVSAPANLADA